MSTIKEAQSWSAEGYARNARFVADLGQPVLELLAPRPGERILDLGCGDGALTAKLVAAGADVVGADASAELVAAARALGLDARIADGQALAFDAEFDAVFSNAALHWMRQPDAVIAGVRRALKPGGRFVGEFGGHGNVAAIVTALVAALNARGLDGAARMPWFFPTPAEYAAKLEAQGFRGRQHRPGAAADAAAHRHARLARHLRQPAARRRRGAARAAILDEVEALLAPSLRDQSGNWSADYVRLRFAATLAS